MPDYTFYVEDYLGEDIPEKEFPRFIRRAGDELRRMREMYAVAPRQGLDPELAESMALCAVADAMYEFAQEDEARGIAKVSVGSVSETYTAPPELCSRTLADRAAQFSPFAALTGHSAAIAETGRLTDQRMELDEYEMARVDAELQRLQELLPSRPTASITYFVPDERKNGGSYQTVTGSVKRIDAVNGVIQMTDRQCIPIADVFSIEIIP